MKIVISGVNTNNKGAELMLYAILQQIEKKHPNADVYLTPFSVKEGLKYIKTKAHLHFMPSENRYNIACRLHIAGILAHLNLQSLFEVKPLNNVDYFFDASGFLFTDQWLKLFTPKFIKQWVQSLESYEKSGTKIIFLPQAFGPIERPETKELIKAINDHASIIMPREKQSFDYLISSGVNMHKLSIYTDFTSLVQCECPSKFKHLNGGVCFIPNMRMIDKGIITQEKYINIISIIAEKARNSGHPIYILNHEGKGDEKCAYMIQERLGKEIEVVTGLTALEVKGLISTAYVCVTSRFHGVASALNSCVPCLATSWSHKYAELYKDYNLSDGVLDITNAEACLAKISKYIDPNFNSQLRDHLKSVKPLIIEQSERMWDTVWSL